MTDKAISALSSTAVLGDSDELVLNQDAGGGAFSTKRIAVSAFKSGLSFASTASPTFTGTVTAAGGLFSDTITINKSANSAFAGLSVNNTNAGSGAYAAISMGNSTSAGMGGLALTGGAYTSIPNRLQLFNGGAGGLELSTSANQPIYFTQNNAEAARIDTNKYLLLGYTSSLGSYKLQINGGAYVGDGVTAGDVITAPLFRSQSISVNGGSVTTLNIWYNVVAVPAGYTIVTVHCNQTGYSGFCHLYKDGIGVTDLAWQRNTNANGVTFQLSGSNLQVKQNVNSAAILMAQVTTLGAY